MHPVLAACGRRKAWIAAYPTAFSTNPSALEGVALVSFVLSFVPNHLTASLPFFHFPFYFFLAFY
jgi:hypothetical protein